MQKQHHLHRHDVSCATIHDVNSRMDKRDRRFPRTRISSLVFPVTGAFCTRTPFTARRRDGQHARPKGIQKSLPWLPAGQGLDGSSRERHLSISLQLLSITRPAPCKLAGWLHLILVPISSQPSQALANTALGHYGARSLVAVAVLAATPNSTTN